MMKAKEALRRGGDYDKAVQWLREKGEATAAKKADREARAGLIDSYVHGGPHRRARGSELRNRFCRTHRGL
jgi:elongation factor Ts